MLLGDALKPDAWKQLGDTIALLLELGLVFGFLLLIMWLCYKFDGKTGGYEDEEDGEDDGPEDDPISHGPRSSGRSVVEHHRRIHDN